MSVDESKGTSNRAPPELRENVGGSGASSGYAVRCFRRSPAGEKRHGVWVMTQPNGPNKYRGVFVHGDHDEFQAPQYSVDDLDEFATVGGWFPCEEIEPSDVLDELKEWPEAQAEIRGVFERHRVSA